jgi:amino acid transporter
MHAQKKISLPTAILININIMIGTGLFINTTAVGKLAGSFGWLSYGIVALLLLPLVLSMAELISLFPLGGFYHFAKSSLNDYAGFLSTWSYFFAKMGSATVGIHTFVTIIQQLFPFLRMIHSYVIDSTIISCFVLLNMKNISTGSYIQKYLILSKIIPISLVIIIGLHCLFGYTSPAIANLPMTSLDDFGSTIPLVLFSLLGFEAICALSNKIEHAEKNGYRAILISYAAVIGIYISYQALFFSTVGNVFKNMIDFKEAFPALFATITDNPLLIHSASSCIYLLIGTSALSGAYGIFFANQWNLFTIAKQHLFMGDTSFAKLNHNQMPFMCAILEGLVCVIYLFITQGQQIILQQLAALGTTVTYIFSVIALLRYTKKRLFVITGYAGAGSCCVLIGACIRNFIYNGFTTLLLYLFIMLIGTILFYIKAMSQKSSNDTNKHTP